MDEALRALEREASNNPSALVRLVALVKHSGGLPYATEFFTEKPTSTVRRSVYTALGGFYVEPIQDEYLGPAWQLYNLPVNGETWNLVYGRKLFKYKNGENIRRTADQHLEYSLAGLDMNPGGVVIASTLVKGSIDLAMFEHKDAPLLSSPVAEYQKDQSEETQYRRIAGKIAYTGEQAILEDIALNRTRHSRTVIAPALDNDYLTLAFDQPEDEIGTLEHIPDNVIPLLTELFGRDYPRIIPAIQYFAERTRDGDLSLVILWTLPFIDRSTPSQRFLSMECYRRLDGFLINCSDKVVSSGPAVGWRLAQKVVHNI
ncbi:hypothetical protein J4219_06145 [Candidatus Woesearchaeota archaeon]|nr:hypothetical protein [Candidatus Woesearchaeota archaeon]